MSAQPYRTPQELTPPVKVEVATDNLNTWERALGLIRDVLLIITCLVILYVVWTGYMFLAELGEQLDQLRGTIGSF